MLAVIPEFLTGAEEETRTLTPVRELDPEPSVSTNFTTSAAGMCLDDLACFGKRFFVLWLKFLKGLCSQQVHAFQQRTEWLGAASRSSWGWRQRSSKCGQRGPNAQPSGSSEGSGTMPGMEGRRCAE